MEMNEAQKKRVDRLQYLKAHLDIVFLVIGITLFTIQIFKHLKK